MTDHDLTMLAVSKFKDESVRGNVEPGNHEVDAHVHVKGTLRVGKPYMTVPTVSIPWLETFALCIRYMGCTRESAKSMLLDVLGEAIRDTGKGKGALADDLEWINETIKEVKDDFLSELPKQPRTGSVSVKGIDVTID